MQNEVIVRLKADIRNLQSGLTAAAAGVNRFVTGTTTSLKRLVNLRNLAVAGTVAGMIKIGSSAEEAENLFDVSFGKMSATVREWSKNLGDRLKVSDTGLRQTAGSFKLFLDGFDLGEDKATAMSQALTKMAYDMSSLRNLRFEDSLTKIQAALAGEVEPLRRLGVTVNDTTLRLWALKNGLDANVKGWSEQQKVIARFGVVQEGLQKDTGDLEKTMGSTTNLLRSISDQVKELSIAVYEQWKPTIQATLTTVRDWLIQNRESVAKWAGRVGAYFGYVKDVFVGFVETLQKSPTEGFRVLMTSLIEVMKAAAEIAVDLAVRIGKGVWEGVRAGVLGESEDTGAIHARAKKIYEDMGGTMYQSKEFTMGHGSPYGGFRDVEKPLSQTMFDSAMQRARMEAQKRRAEQLTGGILSGFGDNAMASFQRAGERGLAVSPGFASAADMAAQNLKQRLAEIDQKFKEGDTTTEEWTESVTAAGAAVDDLRTKLAQLHRDAGGGSGLIAGLQDLRRELPSLAEHLYDVGKAIREGLAGAFADAVFEARNFKEALGQMLKGVAKMMFELQMQKAIAGMSAALPGFIGALPIGGGGSVPTAATPGAGGVHGFARGGIVYAAGGAFLPPRGTDTVPAMLTPGESVLDRQTTAGLRRVFGGAGGASSPNVTFNVQNHTPTPVTIDQTNVQYDGQQMFVSMALKDRRNNGPVWRNYRQR